VAGRAGGVPDAVRDGESGLTVDGDDPAAIAAAVLRLLDDPELYARLRAGGLARADRSDWRDRARQFTALCRRLAGATPEPAAPPD
jgi:glycosyltransferase involved in cell wall biosynthesis